MTPRARLSVGALVFVFVFILAPGVHGGDYQSMGITDLRLDIDQLHGELVEVDVSLTKSGDMVMLTNPEDMGDMNPVMADDSELPREDRRFILERCGMQGCNVTVRGEVQNIMFEPGLMLHELDDR